MTDWLDRAACRGRPTDWWYPGQGDRFTQRVAVMVCRGCPVRAECLAEALAAEASATYQFGIRGGLTAEARVALRGRGDP